MRMRIVNPMEGLISSGPDDTDDKDENVVDALQEDLEPSVLPTLRDESDWFAVVDLRCRQARAMMRRVQWLPDVRVNVMTCIAMCSRIAPVQSFRASRWVVLVPQSPDGTPQSIHNFLSERVPDLVEPNRAGAVVYSGRFVALARDDDILDPPICNRVAHRREEEPLTAVGPSSEDNAPESVSDTESLVSRVSFQGPTVGDVVEEMLNHLSLSSEHPKPSDTHSSV